MAIFKSTEELPQKAIDREIKAGDRVHQRQFKLQTKIIGNCCRGKY